MNTVERDEAGRSFRSLLERAMRGDQPAAWELLETYGSHFLHLLVMKRRELGELPLDAARVVALAWELIRYEPPDRDAQRAAAADEQLNALVLAARLEAPPDLRSETVGMQNSEYPTLGGSSEASSKSAADQIESARRRWQHLTVGPAEHKKILKLRLNGASFEEIASELGLAEAVVRRVIHNLAREGQSPP